MRLLKIVTCFIVLIIPLLLSAEILLEEGFENSFPPADWTILNLGDQTDGETWMQSGTHHYSGDYSAFSQDGAQNEGMEEWLITPAISVPLNSYIELSFWHKYQWASDASSPDYVLISITTPTAEAFTDTALTVLFPGPTSWTEVLVNDLPDYAGQTIYIAFVHTSLTGCGWGDAWVLDDVNLNCFETGEADIGLLSIEVPTEYSFINTEIFPSGRVKNFGNADVTAEFVVNCEIVSESSVTVYSSTMPYSGGLIVGEIDTVTFADAWIPTEIGSYTVTMTAILTGDENSENDFKVIETEVVQHYGTGGPDAFGYRWIDSEVEGGPEYDWIEICESGTSAVMYAVSDFYGDDNFSEPIEFGFDFPFYGINYSYFHVDINGEILLTENTWYNHYPLVGWGTDGNCFNYMMPIPGYTNMPALIACLLYTSPSPRDLSTSRMPSSA